MAEPRIPTQQNLGASEVAAALDLSPWQSSWDLWARKTGRLMGDTDSDVMRAGRLLEPVVLTLAEEKLGLLEREPQTLRIDGSPIVCHLDAFTAKGHQPVEAKTAGMYGPLVGNWGEEGSDDIPDYYWVQLGCYVRATGAEVGHLAALLGGRGFMVYTCPADPELMDQIVNRVGEWGDTHVVGDRPPANSLPSPEVLQRLRRTEATVDLPEEALEWFEKWEEAREERLRFEKIEEEMWGRGAAFLGDAMCGRLPSGRIAGYSEYVARALDQKALREMLPEVAREFTQPSLRRRKFLRKE